MASRESTGMDEVTTIGAALQASEERYRSLAEAMPLIVWTTRADGAVDYYNQRWFEYTGLTLEETQRWGWRPVLHPDDRVPTLRAWEEALRSGAPYEVECRFRRVADDTYRWHLGRARPIRDAAGAIRTWVGTCTDIDDQKRSEAGLREQSETIATVNRIGRLLSAELDLQKLVQAVTDAATELTGAQFGAFFYNLVDEQGESYTLYSLSGVAFSTFAHMPMPRNTHIFAPTFRGAGAIRLDDVQADPRYAQNPPYFGVPAGHLPVRSYLAVPVVARSGEVLGALFFGHAEAGVFSARAEHLAVGLAAQAAVAMDNARLYQRVQEALREREATIGHQHRLEEQLTRLVEASSTLIGDLQLDTLLPAILEIAGRLVAADAYALWRYHPADNTWSAACATGLSAAFAQVALAQMGSHPPLDQPILAEDVMADPELGNRVAAYRQEGIRSLLVIPLRIQGQASGTIAFYAREPRRFSPGEVRVTMALANIAAAAIGSAELYAAQSRLHAEAEAAQHRLAFLAEVSSVLATSLDYAATLQTVARLAVPTLADWCTIDVPDEHGHIRQLALAHSDPARIALAAELRRRYPSERPESNPTRRVLATGQAFFVPEIRDAMLVASAQDPEHLALMRGLGMHSLICLPLPARGRTLGVLSLVRADPARSFDLADLALAEEVARRAGIAVDNARLYAEAQHAIQVREEFLSIASHELKTPLTGLQLQVQMLMRLSDRGTLTDVPAERLYAMLERAERQTKQLDKLINTLLDLSRLGAGRLELDLEDVDLAEVVRAVGDRLAPELVSAGCRLTVAAGGPVVGRWDRARLDQVVTNLVGNALKYGRGRPIAVALGADAGTAWLTVADGGIGIAPEHLDRIFGRFERAVTAENYGGFGLGLYIVRQIVDALGGTIAVTSTLGAGATFRVTLPLRGTSDE